MRPRAADRPPHEWSSGRTCLRRLQARSHAATTWARRRRAQRRSTRAGLRAASSRNARPCGDGHSPPPSARMRLPAPSPRKFMMGLENTGKLRRHACRADPAARALAERHLQLVEHPAVRGVPLPRLGIVGGDEQIRRARHGIEVLVAPGRRLDDRHFWRVRYSQIALRQPARAAILPGANPIARKAADGRSERRTHQSVLAAWLNQLPAH